MKNGIVEACVILLCLRAEAGPGLLVSALGLMFSIHPEMDAQRDSCPALNTVKECFIRMKMKGKRLKQK